jgi:hypothetical protein
MSDDTEYTVTLESRRRDRHAVLSGKGHTIVTLASRRREQREAENKKLAVWHDVIVEAIARSVIRHRLEERLAR